MGKRIKLKGKLKTYMNLLLWLGALFAAMNLWIYYLNVQAGIIISCFLVVYFIAACMLVFYNKPLIVNEMISFATEYGQIQKQLLRDLELPHALLDDSGRILWTNEAFEKVIQKEKGYMKSITSFLPAITQEKLPRESEESQLEFVLGDSEYLAKMKKISITDTLSTSTLIQADDYEGYLIGIYLFDQTALKIALRENDDQSLAVGMVYIDNYEEAFESVEEVRRSLLVALVNRKITLFFTAVDGIIRKTEKDKYFVVLRKKAVAQLKESRFDLLEEVKTLSISGEMPVTLSIGIGVDGLTYSQNYEFARTSIDLALGRGGDQAVIKTPETLAYFGGKSQQMEKNTRVKARVKAQALEEIISTKDKIIIMGHKLTDVDSFGAAIGIYCIARALGRKAHIVLGDYTSSMRPLVELFKHNSEYDEDMILTGPQAIEAAGPGTALAIVDVNKPSYTECPELIKCCKSIMVLDHHRQGAETIENATLSYVEPYASSACEMVAEILQYVSGGIRIKGVEADCLYAGIMVDTNNYMTKTGVRTFEAAAFLRRNGADVTRVRKIFREDAADYMIKADCVRRAVIYRNAYAISVCSSENIQSPTVLAAQASNELLNINGIRASFVLTEYLNQIYVSARSIDEVNVQVIMERLGGGGHMNVAGTQFEHITVEEAIEKIKATLDTMAEEGELG